MGMNKGHRIVGGEDTAPGEINWQISFQSTSFGAFHFCGGSVYNEVICRFSTVPFWLKFCTVQNIKYFNLRIYRRS